MDNTEILIGWYDMGYEYATWGVSRGYIPNFNDKSEQDSWIIGFHDKKEGKTNRFDEEYE